jgi:hypothetical protein
LLLLSVISVFVEHLKELFIEGHFTPYLVDSFRAFE